MIRLDELLEQLNVKPITKTNGLSDHVRFVEFPKKDNFEFCLEFEDGKPVDDAGQYCYFEVLDMSGYVEGKIIENFRRLHVWNEKLNVENLWKFVDHMNSVFEKYYGKEQ